MFYKVNIHYEGGWQFEIDAKSEDEAKEKAEAAFADLSPAELINNLADSFVDDCYPVEEIALTADEYNSLEQIASATKMDCWFHIESHNGFDYVYDLEQGCRLSIQTAVGQLLDGMVEPIESPFYKLSDAEIKAFKNLLKNLGYSFER